MQKQLISLFGAYQVLSPDDVYESSHEATLMDIVALAMEYRYAFTPDLLMALADLNSRQLGHVFKDFGAAMHEVHKTVGKTSPLYKAFPNHTIIPFEQRLCLWFLRHMGYEMEFSAELYGADPVTGFQVADINYDEPFSLKFSDEGGNHRRKIRFIKLADKDFISGKLNALMSNLTPFSEQELAFVKEAIHAVGTDALGNIKFREKLPLLWTSMTSEEYAAACNSVTDVLRLAVSLSGTSVKMSKGSSWTGGMTRGSVELPDLSLKTPPRFRLSTSNTKRVLAVLEAILDRGNTDHETDFLRHAEFWKRLSSHIRVRQFDKRFPKSTQCLLDLRLGWMKSWESRFASANLPDKIGLAKERPGVLVRRLSELNRQAQCSADSSQLLDAAKDAFESVDVMKLFQLRTHLAKTAGRTDRFHMLPDGKLLKSTRAPDQFNPLYLSNLDKALKRRLADVTTFSNKPPLGAYGMFVPAGNRSMSDADTRTSRGDRVKLDFEDTDTVRFFLHWKESCDVDMSAVFYGENLEDKGRCTYYDQASSFYKHSGDILDGRHGAAEYIDIDVAKARAKGVRFILMTANVYSGMDFSTFPCYAGVMIRDGQTGKHFEVSTVESKLSLDSDTRNTSPAIFDLKTGEMIYLDLPSNWGSHSNVDMNRASLAETLKYFLEYNTYRPSFGEILKYAGTDCGTDDLATIRENKDEILAALAEA